MATQNLEPKPKYIIEFFDAPDKKPRVYDASTPSSCFEACLYEFAKKYNAKELNDKEEFVKQIVTVLTPKKGKKPDYYYAGKLAYLYMKASPEFAIRMRTI